MTCEEKRVYGRAYYAANREKMKANSVAYYAANPEKSKAASRTWKAANPEKVKANHVVWRAANPEKPRARALKWNAAHPEKRRAGKLMKRYGLTPEAFQLMRLEQKNACGICKEIFSKVPHVDHCHKTGEVRGLLCGSCNKALGGFKDSLEILESAKEYLLGC